jgi:hypothetical protein
MKSAQQPPAPPTLSSDVDTITRLLILPDGRVLAHNLTPWMAQILHELAPGDSILEQRQRSSTGRTVPKPAPPEAITP